ncbi:MAG: VOC family protein [Hyphomicrobiales bacterium]|nr:VOC family protein [Alphaproteobacteria bacterium]
MSLQTLGYIGLRTKNLEDWTAYAERFLGMQLVDKSRGTASFRMDDKKQRLVVHEDAGDAPGFFGWEVADATALDSYAANLERHKVPFARGSRALAEERKVRDLIVLNDPAGNRLEIFHGAETTGDPFKPGRAISGFRTGPLGMGHAVLHCEKIADILPFYQDILGFHLSDYFTKPFSAYFFHVNPRHHSVAFIESGNTGIHHLMVETCYLDDVGQGYDLAQKNPEMIATTFGRHYNDQVHSFYSWSPSKFMFEYGWGGRSIDTENWTPEIITQGPSLWGHERYWLNEQQRNEARELRISNAEKGYRLPLNVMEGNHQLARDVCPWWDATAPARKTG